jgi:hypothetical protein
MPEDEPAIKDLNVHIESIFNDNTKLKAKDHESEIKFGLIYEINR